MKKKLFLLLFILTLTLTACTNDSGTNQNIDQIILSNVVEEIQFPSMELEGNITLPTQIDGYILTWKTTSPSTITENGIVTRPDDGDGDSIVTLTVTITSNGESVSKDFIFTVLEAAVTVEKPIDPILHVYQFMQF